jgi:hypothetical protein
MTLLKLFRKKQGTHKSQYDCKLKEELEECAHTRNLVAAELYFNCETLQCEYVYIFHSISELY